MKIGFIGAPMAGKTALAQQLRPLILEAYGPTQVIDDYVPVITDRSDVALGMFATYVGNLQVALGRFEVERRASKDGAKNLIVCGTIVDTIAHDALRSFLDNNAGDQQAQYQNYLRTALSMEMLGTLYADLWDYDHTFYLPLSEDRKDESEYVWSARVNEALLDTLNELEVPHTKLGDNRIEQVLAEIKEKDEASDGQRDSGDSTRGQKVGNPA